jgi:hypothetical protein
MNSPRKSKLKLQTETIMPLGSDDLNAVNGGFTPVSIISAASAASSGLCLRGSIAVTASSQRCAQSIGETIARAPEAIRQGNEWVRQRVTFSF